MKKTKIHITWPPGCYGSYIMQSVYAYSNLVSNSNITVNSDGSSHNFRDGEAKKKHFICDHLLSIDSDILVSGVPDHALDYFVNQFVKQDESNLQKYLLDLFPNFKTKVQDSWTTEQVWSLREWASFWLLDLFANTYQYNPKADITTNHLFAEDENVFPQAIIALINKQGLSVNADLETIKFNHANWQSSQQYHNLQNRCDKWVDEIITTQENTASPCITLLDEAYVQNRLRSQGYEIRCFNLNTFPKTSNELRQLIYKDETNDIT